MVFPGRAILLAIVAVAVAFSGSVHASGCEGVADLLGAQSAATGRLRCDRRLLRGIATASCRPGVPPACASDVPDALAVLVGTAGIAPIAGSGLAAQLRCQATVLKAAERFVRVTLGHTASGLAYRRVHQRAVRVLRSLPRDCHVPIVDSPAGPLPRLGGRCAAAGGAVGQMFDVAAVATCLADGLAYESERVIRPWLRPNIVFVYTDDQRWDTLPYMPTVQSELVAKGVEFTNSYVATALCCPARASVLTGQYAHHTGILTNGYPLPRGGMARFDDHSTLATWLQGAGYRTGLFGKYLNGYTAFAPYIPPGWDRWSVFETPWFYDYALSQDGRSVAYGATAADYSSDVLARQVVDFIRTADDTPFFVWYGPYAPHLPATPAPRHVGTFSGIPLWRPPSFNEADVSDKPPFFDATFAPMTPMAVETMDAWRVDMLESLLAVDEAVGDIMTALRDTGHERNTMVVFTSDNGHAWGEHRWGTKLCPYEECRRVPLVIRYPGLTPVGRQDDRFVLNIDLAPTFTELAHATAGLPVDGASLVPVLDEQAVPWRADILGEHWGIQLPTFALVQDAEWKLVEYYGGLGIELYHLPSDPYELHSVDADPANLPRIFAMLGRIRQLRPTWPPPGLFEP